MKFELMEPSDEGGATTSEFRSEPGSPADPAEDTDGPPRSTERGIGRQQPVRKRMSAQIDGVRASMDLLRARAAELSMSENGRAPEGLPEAEPPPVFHAHMFTPTTEAGR
ncbi:hypothetical protein DFP74_6092 [Nocardiopsis sp. Huas11]|nr:hypothetical protein DFP74_6092 [Nocardiopsis sp. Huas11]